MAKLAGADWSEKFKAALEISEPTTKAFYDDLLNIRRQLRNFVAHGSFGKQREAFTFHSGAGAVPVRLPTTDDRNAYKFGHGADFVDPDAIDRINAFIDHLWSGPLAPARLYLQESTLPVILSMAVAGDYRRALANDDDMQMLTNYLEEQSDHSANMDF